MSISGDELQAEVSWLIRRLLELAETAEPSATKRRIIERWEADTPPKRIGEVLAALKPPME
jgi:hypothetical protein